MRARLGVVVVLAAAAAPTVAAAPPTPVPGGPIELGAKASATATADPATHGARPVELVLTLRTELHCGRLNGRAVLITVPSAVRLPASIARTSVRVGGGAPASVVVSGHTVALSMPQPSGVICDVIAPGAVRIVFARAAGLGNPATVGRHPFRIAAGTAVATATLVTS
jgi:hypothetical protein